ncbi:hypothetical protein CLOP_g23216 [Closterium sp. NIES-67]|nr:hypothetical protein CLOP_g23216 [Closterium sp. NIES-67]
MAWQRRHRGLDAIVAVVCLLATVSVCSGGIPYNVSLASITLFHKYSWFTAPAVYLACGNGIGGNRTELPGVNATMVWFNFTGNETWQPVAKLHREECTECGLYEHEWLGDAIYDTWTVCAANFSSRDAKGLFTHVVPSRFHVNMACYECNHAQFQRNPFAGHGVSEGAAGSMSVFFWMGLAVAGAGLMILLVAAIVYLVTEADEVMDESEKSRFIEMAEEGHEGHGGHDGHNGHGPSDDPTHRDERDGLGGGRYHDDDQSEQSAPFDAKRMGAYRDPDESGPLKGDGEGEGEEEGEGEGEEEGEGEGEEEGEGEGEEEGEGEGEEEGEGEGEEEGEGEGEEEGEGEGGSDTGEVADAGDWGPEEEALKERGGGGEKREGRRGRG